MAKRISPKRIFPKKRKKLKRIIQFLSGFLFCFVAFSSAVFLIFTKDLPRPEKFGEGQIIESTKIFDRTGKVLLYELCGDEKRTFVPLAQIPEHLKQVIINTEDKNFYQHKGFDLKAIARAVLFDLRLGQLEQGASTISQQLIRNYFLTREKNIKRKTQELVLTLELERRYPKDKILEWYLNLIPFGSNLYGVETASQTFFKKSVSEISLAQSAILAAMIKSPSYFWPYGEHLQDLLNRKNIILSNMHQAEIITEEELEKAKQEEIVFNKDIQPIKAPHFVMFVKDYLEKRYGRNFLNEAGWRVYTTLDMGLQEKGEKILQDYVETLAQYNTHNAGMVVLDPKNGEILAMVGSKNYFGTSTPSGCIEGDNCKFDPQTNVTLALRPPGSAFKPFAYVQVFANGFNPNSVIWDIPTEFNPKCSGDAAQKKDPYGLDCYNPQNYDGKFKGIISLRSALGQSRNLPAVKILYLVGLKKTLGLAKDMGITTLNDEDRYGLALVLGGGEVKLLEMVSAYGIFANDGIKHTTNFIIKVEDSKGKIKETAKQGFYRILPTQAVRQLNDVLSDNEARAPMFGYNSALYLKDYQAAVKTGTTQENKDAWCIGYTPGLVVGVWAGNNNNSSMTKAGGVFSAAPIWQEFMLKTLPDFPKEEFIKPLPVVAEKPFLSGGIPEPHCILYYINKNDPLGDGNSQDDIQFPNWEQAVQNWVNIHK